ncbi:uncharacterized protein LOC131943172 [Physella acuta]|uniref:uncharacterized protein LOC131943172 n=1 Tax=Physella acuta TaxID=109671 RepID=UPI0027DCF80E|nr:uncharacterized protein LOC131943172 [Physella acuta]
MGDDTWFYFIFVLIQGPVIQVSSADIVIECSKQCGLIDWKNIICQQGYGVRVTDVNVSAQRKDEAKEEKLKYVIRRSCDAKKKCNLDNLPVELSTILPAYAFSKVNIIHECVELLNWDISFFTTGLSKTITHIYDPMYLVVRPEQTLDTSCDVVDADKTGAVNVTVLYLEFNEDRTLSGDDQVKLTGCNQTVKFNVSRLMPMTCPTVKIEINLTRGFLWMEINAQKSYRIKCISHYTNIEDINTNTAQPKRGADVLLVVVSVVAVLAVFIVIIGMRLVYVCHIKRNRSFVSERVSQTVAVNDNRNDHTYLDFHLYSTATPDANSREHSYLDMNVDSTVDEDTVEEDNRYESSDGLDARVYRNMPDYIEVI